MSSEQFEQGQPLRDHDILTGILKISSEAIVVTDHTTRILMFSAGAEAIFGYRADEIVGQPITRLIPPRFRALHEQHVDAFAEGPAETKVMRERGAIFALRKDGEAFPVEASLSKRQTPDGLVFTTIIRDITERQRAEAALAEAAAAAKAATIAKSAFLATMSHEIRTPLNGVLGMAQVMAFDELSPVQKDRLDVIRQSGEALLAILNDVLDLSKIEAGKLDLEAIEFDLGGLVRGAHAAFTTLANKKGLSFALDIDQADGAYLGDPTRVRQILYNLISNALKFTETGEVRVTAAHRDGGLRLAVADTGIGMAPEALASLFNAFVQADATTTRRYGGTGLGLAISRELTELMGGSIDVTSALGRGTTFEVFLPLRRKGAAFAGAPAIEPPAEVAAPRPDIRVLAAEDNPTNQLVLKTLLHQAGIQPVVVANGLRAVEAWEAGEFDVILMDVQMPDLDGPTATRIIRRKEAGSSRPRTPIIGLTANAMSHQVQEYLAAGMDAIVTKPIDIGKLFEALDKALASEPAALAG
jgi:PAS domain S-box-containing protein